jgi:hypothetical protein
MHTPDTDDTRAALITNIVVAHKRVRGKRDTATHNHSPVPVWADRADAAQTVRCGSLWQELVSKEVFARVHHIFKLCCARRHWQERLAARVVVLMMAVGECVVKYRWWVSTSAWKTTRVWVRGNVIDGVGGGAGGMV